MSKRTRSKKGKTPQSSSSPFVSQNASYRHVLIYTKNVNSGQTMVLSYFEHLNYASILASSYLENYVTIKEPVYPTLVQYFYFNLTFEHNHIRSRVLGRNIDMTLQEFACHLHLSCEGIDIYNFDLHDFEYPDGESAHTVSTLLHDDDNPGLARNEEVKYYTLTAQVLPKIVFYNLL